MKRLELLDYARFIAAIIVVLYHYTFNGIANGKVQSIEHTEQIIAFTKYGYLGVELFFMISGYVILFSAKNRNAAQFITSRASRLYPAYWFAVLFTATITFLSGSPTISIYFNQVIANLTLFHSFFGIGHVDGVYWTLVYELKFYFAVFLILLLGWQKQLTNIFLCWPLIMVIALWLEWEKTIYLGGYYSYFCAGALFALLKIEYKHTTLASLVICYLISLNYSLGAAEMKNIDRNVIYSPYIIVIIITTFLYFLLLQITKNANR